MFFEQFFQQRGDEITPDDKGEVSVRCPFPHTEGYTDKKTAAFFNVEKRIFGCFACRAADREEGFSETGFIAKLYDVTYEQAIQIKTLHEGRTLTDFEQTTEMLLQNEEYRTYLTDKRGLTVDTIRKYKLGYAGDGIRYPILLNGLVADIRTYDPNGTPKIRSEKGAKPLLFPYDEWKASKDTTILSAGENDTLLFRQMMFNAVCSTGGEGGIPKLLLNAFKNKHIIIVYDCDEAGRKGARKLAYYLIEAGAASVRIANLGLEDGEDVTDFILKYGKTKEDLQVILDAAVTFTEEDFIEEKNKVFPLVNLWDVEKGEHRNQYISSRVSMMGRFEKPLEIPTAMEWKCRGAVEGSKTCDSCRFGGQRGEWAFNQNSMRDILKTIEVNDQIKNNEIKSLIGLPQKCPNSQINILSVKPVQKVIFAPDVETENESSGFKQAELHAYVVDNKLDDGNKYRIFFKRVPHPKDQSIVLVVDRVEESDNSINRFKVTPEFLAASRKWQGHPDVIMKRRYEELGKPAIGSYIPESIFFATEIMFHSVLDMKFIGKNMKGHPEIAIVGASRTGKSEVAQKLSEWYQLGNMTDAKTSSQAGMIGGAESTNGGWRLKWGLIPRNNRGLVIIDEVSGMPIDVFNKLTPVRSQRLAKIEKIVSGSAPAKTRLMWIGNPRVGNDKRSKSLAEYSTGVEVVLDLFGSDEDVARFDCIVLVPEGEKYVSELDDDGNLQAPPPLPEELRDIIRWVWSRTAEQVVFENKVEKYIEYVADELNKEFGSSVKIIGHEGAKKIARMSISVAACCFSCSDDGEKIVVKKDHVDWVFRYLNSLYDNSIFRLREFVERERKFTTIDDVIVQRVAVLMKNEPLIVSELMIQTECNINHLKLIANDPNFGKLLNTMVNAGLVQTVNANSRIKASLRLRKAVNRINGTY